MPTPVLRLFADGVELDLVAIRAGDFVLEVGYSHPALLRFTVAAPQHTLPIGHRAFLVFCDQNFGGPEAPLFEGHVHEINPGIGANEIRYVAYDATRLAAQEATVMNGPHNLGSSYPRAVWNCKIDNDDDRAFELDHDATVATIVQTIFDNALSELVPLRAAPPSGSAYVPGELVGFDYRSQEKVVFESESLRGALDRLLDLYPQYRIRFEPGPSARQWRFVNVHASPSVTLRLNDHTATNPTRVLSLKLDRSLEGRYAAVKIFGPERTQAGDVNVAGGTLARLWNTVFDGGFEVSGPSGSPSYVDVSRKWQIVDPAKRHLASLLPAAVTVTGFRTDEEATTTVYTRVPLLLASWDGGSSWESVGPITLDRGAGIIQTPIHVYKYDPATLRYELPDNVRLVFAYYTPGLSVRYPASGFSGSAHAVAGVQAEMRRYDESLAVGYERYLIADQTERLAQFQKLAQSIQEASRDIVYTGGCVLLGMQYEFLRLDRRVNFAAVDGAGNDLTTGWEGIDAILTDVEYDFGAGVTTLAFSSDHLEFAQADPEELKRLLKLSALAEPSPRFVEIRYEDSAGRFNARFVVRGDLNEDRYSGEA